MSLLKRSGLKFVALLILAAFGSGGCSTVGSKDKPPAAAGAGGDPWAQLAVILRRIVPPKFPARDFDITNYGAVADGQTSCTAAFRAAIAACAQAGGGRVVVPAGKFFTAAIHLRSGVNLHLSAGAEICFSDRPEDYLPVVLVRGGGVEFYNYSPLIYARDCINVAVTGPGKLNGNARRWWDWKSKELDKTDLIANRVPLEKRIYGKPEFAIRPSFLSLVNCTNILFEDFTIGSGPNWTIHPIYCQNLTVRGVTVATDGPNNDGIDPDSCRDVLIERCTFDTGDDCVVLKSGSNEDAWRVGRATENVIMRECSAQRGHGGLVIGSEMSGDVRNVFMENCQFAGTDRAIRIKSKRGRGGVVEHVYARNIVAKNLQREVVILNMDYGSDRTEAASPKPPVFRDMVFEHITGVGAPAAINIQGLPDSPIANLTFRHLDLATTKGVIVNHATKLHIADAKLTPSTGALFDFTDVTESCLRHVRTDSAGATFLRLQGPSANAIRIQTADGVKPKIQLGAGVSATAVVVE